MVTSVDGVEDGLDGSLTLGLIFLGAIAVSSALSTVTLIGFIGYRASKWNAFYSKDIKKNVFVVLLCNLFLADFFQSFGFLFSWHWLGVHDIISNTGPCTVQGFLINFGDVASAFFVLTIAVQTWAHLRFQRQLRYDAFLAIIICIWIFALVLAVLGPVTTSNYFVDTGAWCWVDANYKSQRLAYHYFWIFLVEFGTVVVYGFVIWELRRSSQKLQAHSEVRLQQATETHRQIRKSGLIMCAYPFAYVTLTLPLAVSRMCEINNIETSLQYRIFCGCFLVSSGWVDSVLYVLTRASFLKSQGHVKVTEERSANRRSMMRSQLTPTPPLDTPPRALQGSPAPSNRTRGSRASLVPDEPVRLHSMSGCSWGSDAKTLAHSRAEELQNFDPEKMSHTRTLTLDAKMHEAH